MATTSVVRAVRLSASSAIVFCAGLAQAQLSFNNPLLIDEVVEELSIGDGGHGCIVNNCGDVRCWGESGFGEAANRTGVFHGVATGRNHTCALNTQNNPVCWGDSRYGQTHHPAGPFQILSAGAVHTCGLRSNGTVTCWGNIAQPNITGQVIDISSGAYHACAVVDTPNSQYIQCWGSGSQGQTSPPGPNQIPVTFPNNFGVHDFTTGGGFHSCSLTTGDFLQCWGYNAHFQASDEHPNFPGSPWATDQGGFFDFGYRFELVDAGMHHTCGLRRTSNASNVMCWGYDVYGQSSNEPSGRFGAIAAGDYFSCGVRENQTSIECWGLSAAGRTQPPVINKCERHLIVNRPTIGFGS